MKKLLLIVCVMILLSLTVCYAGDIPESLLGGDKTQVYFGEVKDVRGKVITVIQRQNIKGEFSEDCELTFSEFVFTDSPRTGETYLCGYIDDNNPLYIWEVTSLDTKKLSILNTDNMSKRMQGYLNSGQFEEKEKERQAAINTNHEMDSSPKETVIPDRRGSNRKGPGYLILLLPLLGIILLGIFIFLKLRRK